MKRSLLYLSFIVIAILLLIPIKTNAYTESNIIIGNEIEEDLIEGVECYEYQDYIDNTMQEMQTIQVCNFSLNSQKLINLLNNTVKLTSLINDDTYVYDYVYFKLTGVENNAKIKYEDNIEKSLEIIEIDGFQYAKCPIGIIKKTDNQYYPGCFSWSEQDVLGLRCEGNISFYNGNVKIEDLKLFAGIIPDNFNSCSIELCNDSEINYVIGGCGDKGCETITLNQEILKENITIKLTCDVYAGETIESYPFGTLNYIESINEYGLTRYIYKKDITDKSIFNKNIYGKVILEEQNVIFLYALYFEEESTDQKDINNLDKAIDTSNKEYTGEEIKTNISIKDGNYTLIEGTDYSVLYENNIEIGTANFKITGLGNYTGEINNTFNIISINEYYTYKILTDGTIEITNYTAYNTQIIEIPSEIDGYRVSKIGDNAFINEYLNASETEIVSNNRQHKKIIIPEGVISIGKDAFNACDKLEEIDFPSTLLYIGNDAFQKCSNLKEVIIPDSTTSIGIGAFWGNSSLESVKLPKDIEIINDLVFAHCTNLRKIEIPVNVKEIKEEAFYQCTSLEKIEIPQNVYLIEWEAFGSCTGLTEVDFNNVSEIEIQIGAFYNCNNLKKVVMPNSITNIKENTNTQYNRIFEGASSELLVYVDANSYAQQFCIENQYNYIVADRKKDINDLNIEIDTSNKEYTGEEIKTNISIKDGDYTLIEGTDYSVLYENNIRVGTASLNIEGLDKYEGEIQKEFKITTNVEYEINENEVIIKGYSGGDKLIIPDYIENYPVTEIASGAFSAALMHAHSMKEIIFPNTLKVIRSAAFSGCYNLYKIIIPEGVTTIESSAFGGCIQLKTVILPKSVSNVDENAFTITYDTRAQVYIYGYKDTYAHNYAETNGYTFKKRCKVTFYDYNQNLLKEQEVREGFEAIAPEEPVRNGYRFIGWDKDLSNVTDDMEIVAQYVKLYIVVFKNYNADILKTEIVAEGENATAPENLTRESYKFIGWDKTFDNIISDLEITAQYAKIHTVRFIDYDNDTLKTEEVVNGENATPPEDPIRDGYIFIQWDKDFSNITDDTEIMATYREKETYTVTFKDYNGNIIKTQNVLEGENATAPENPTREGYKFIGWDKIFENINENIEINAQYSKLHTVIFRDYDETILKTDQVIEGESAVAPENPNRIGYTFSKWDKAFNNVVSDLIVNAEYTKKSNTFEVGRRRTTTLSTTDTSYSATYYNAYWDIVDKNIATIKSSGKTSSIIGSYYKVINSVTIEGKSLGETYLYLKDEEGNILKTSVISVISITEDVSSINISDIPAQTYKGTEICPNLELKSSDGTALVKNSDYTVSYLNNINPGTATVIIKGIDTYTGEVTRTFEIQRKNINEVTVRTDTSNKIYTGSPINTAILITDGTYTLIENKDYTVSYKNNTNAGTATVTITGMGNYIGEKAYNYTIQKASMVNSSSNYEGVYDGKEHSINLKVNVSNSTIRYSIDNTNYNLTTLPTFKEVGEYTVNYKITKDNYNSLIGSNKVNIYGIKKLDSTLEIRNNMLIVKNYKNNFTDLCNRIQLHAKSKSYLHLNQNKNSINDLLVKTGEYIQLVINDSKTQEYMLCVLADVNGDGKISALDYVKIKNHIMKTNVISSDIALIAADANDDGKISALDYVRIKNYIMNGGV